LLRKARPVNSPNRSILLESSFEGLVAVIVGIPKYSAIITKNIWGVSGRINNPLIILK
jgi:hypothetical protein